jgi:hypothetical protein
MTNFEQALNWLNQQTGLQLSPWQAPAGFNLPEGSQVVKSMPGSGLYVVSPNGQLEPIYQGNLGGNTPITATKSQIDALNLGGSWQNGAYVTNTNIEPDNASPIYGGYQHSIYSEPKDSFWTDMILGGVQSAMTAGTGLAGTIGSSAGLTGVPAAALGGAAIGGTTSALQGGNPLQGAISGGIGAGAGEYFFGGLESGMGEDNLIGDSQGDLLDTDINASNGFQGGLNPNQSGTPGLNQGSFNPSNLGVNGAPITNPGLTVPTGGVSNAGSLTPGFFPSETSYPVTGGMSNTTGTGGGGSNTQTPQPGGYQFPYGSVLMSILHAYGLQDNKQLYEDLVSKLSNPAIVNPWSTQQSQYWGPLQNAVTQGIGNTDYGKSIAKSVASMDSAKGYNMSGNMLHDIAQGLHSGTMDFVKALTPLAMGQQTDFSGLTSAVNGQAQTTGGQYMALGNVLDSILTGQQPSTGQQVKGQPPNQNFAQYMGLA